MSDPLSIAGSIAGIVQLSASVFQQISRFVKEVKGAQKDVKDLANQTRNLSGVLQNLALLASSLEHEGSTSTFKAYHLHACRLTLLDVEKRLEKALHDFESGSRSKTISRSLKWPFTSNETKAKALDMNSHRSTIALALSADTLENLLRCLERQDNVKDSLSSLHRKMERLTTIQARVEVTEKRQRVIDFFLQVNPQSNLQTAVRLRQPLTGLWLTESNPLFQKWRNLPNSRIWLSGIPGAGKTILSGFVVEEILQESNTSTAIAFFFCDYKNYKSQNLVEILSAFVVQLAQQNEAAFSFLEDYYNHLRPTGGLQKEREGYELYDLLLRIIQQFEKTFIIIDGLDECGDNTEEVAMYIRKLSEETPSTSIAVFSRDEQEIRDELTDEFSHIEIAAHKEDLDIYVRAEMSRRKQLRKIGIQDSKLSDEIRDKLISQAQGMFRWVACQLDYLCELTTNRARREALATLPPTLPETYHRILRRILERGPHLSNLVRKVLHWTMARPSLTFAELREAVSFPDSEIDEFGPDDLVDEDEIFRRCSSLVRKSLRKSTAEYEDEPELHLELAHFTVEEYLENIEADSDVRFFMFDYAAGQREIMLTCLRFFIFNALHLDNKSFSRAATVERSIIDRLTRSPFYLFATNHVCKFSTCDFECGDDFWEQTQNSSIFEKLASIFKSRNGIPVLELVVGSLLGNNFGYQYPLGSPLHGKYDKKSTIELVVIHLLPSIISPKFTALQLAAAMGVPKLCVSLIEEEASIDMQNLEDSLYYSFGTMGLFLHTLRLRLGYNKSYSLFGSLFARISTQRRETINLLLAIKTGMAEGETRPIAAEKLQSEKFERNTLLHFAVAYDDPEIVHCLLARGAEPSAKNSASQDALDGAILQNHSRVMKLLIRPDLPEVFNSDCLSKPEIDLEESSQSSDNELDWDFPPTADMVHKAIRQGSIHLFKSIFRQGLSLEVALPGCVSCPVTPLLRTIEYNEREMFTWLISNGASLANVSCHSLPFNLQNIISLAIYHDNDDECVELALNASLGQAVSWVEEDFNPFHVAALEENFRAIEILIAHINYNWEKIWQGMRASNLRTKYKSKTGQHFLVHILSRCSIVSPGQAEDWPTGGKFVGTSLHYSIASGSVECTKLLVERGADINALDQFKRSPLILAAQLGSTEVARILVDAGADLSAYDCCGRTSIMFAAQNGDIPTMDVILNKDRSFLGATSYIAMTLLHFAAQSGDKATRTFHYLITKGADPYYRPCQDFSKRSSAVTATFTDASQNVHLMTYILNSGLPALVDESEPVNPLSRAIDFRQPSLLKRLLRFFKNHQMIDRYLNEKTMWDFSPLCLASMNGLMQCLDQLVAFGADVNKEGCFHGSPLMAACKFGRLESVKKLIRSGALISYTNEQGNYQNAMEAGCHHGQIVAWLLVGRFQDQVKLSLEPHSTTQKHEVVQWSGASKVKWRLTGKDRPPKNCSSFAYLCTTQRLRRWAEGRVVV